MQGLHVEFRGTKLKRPGQQAGKELDEEITSWKAQPVGQIQYLVLDATYESVRAGSHVVKQALLVAIGVDYSGNRHILDAEVANSEERGKLAFLSRGSCTTRDARPAYDYQ
ncbi:transposase [Escherichia coli]